MIVSSDLHFYSNTEWLICEALKNLYSTAITSSHLIRYHISYLDWFHHQYSAVWEKKKKKWLIELTVAAAKVWCLGFWLFKEGKN